MKRLLQLFLILPVALPGLNAIAQQGAPPFEILGFSIAAPGTTGVDRFVKFINEELAPRKVNTLLLRVDYNYQYESHPELRRPNALSESHVKMIVAACRKNNIRIIPQINLLGHQGGGTNISNLLKVYPQFEEVPHIDMYKSYCPLHPDLHKIIFALIDEITGVFETDAFHAGMDEVFYIGEPNCPRCSGKDKSVLFANEVKKIRDHLKAQGKEMWIWGDRLLDAKATGLGYWEGSFNDTHWSADMIPKDVVVCDWHYNRAVRTDIDLAGKGLRVVTCPWKNPQVAIAQIEDMLAAKKSSKTLDNNLYGMMHTVWTNAERFLDGYYGVITDPVAGELTEWNTFRRMYDKITQLSSARPE